MKVDNSPEARPQAGVNQADIVYELRVEGITRYMEVFHSHTPERVGPVRSARSSDINLLSNLNRPLLAWSGGNPGVTNEVLRGQDNGLLVDAGRTPAGHFYRDDTGRAPHNLFTRSASWPTSPPTTPPPPLFP